MFCVMVKPVRDRLTLRSPLRAASIRDLDDRNVIRENDSNEFECQERIMRILMPIGDGTEALDTYYAYYRLPEDGYEVVIAIAALP